MSRAFLLTLQFDGTEYCGWQRQREDRSVQGVIEEVLSRLAGMPVKATAAGRTDAGVHALALPVTATMPVRWEAGELLRAANSLLPRSIAVAAVREVRPGTDARRSAMGRRYRYDVGTSGSARSPFRARTCWPLGRQLEFGALRGAAGVIAGEHDFRAFAAVGEPKPHYRCTVREAVWQLQDDGVVRFEIAADRFLHHMVRFLVGTMVEIGLGRRQEADMAELLTLATNDHTSPPAPASGLSFLSAEYPDQVWAGPEATW
ncbi:MAG TPA: tRNA pseudouridine synthase A [Gemmatimonadales bacterium]|nr:tRNA pseudouridine synthase A [Gemmatimonadales bacterium]